jgi:hypothetical protein
MKRWAIVIGINQYHHLQPLSYAQRDAQALHHFLIQKAGFEPDHCLLLSDNSPPVGSEPTLPDRATLQNWLDRICEQGVQPDDLVWFFFSGYGICQQGKDYVMPIDGNPTDPENTAVSVESVLSQLKRTAARTILTLLDISRSQSSLPDGAIGAQTAQLAETLQIPTLLSCQPGQFSYDSSELQHGFFTAALLEILSQQAYPTVASLYHCLKHRSVELSQHYRRPAQQPFLICPPSQLYQVVLPEPEFALVASRVASSYPPQSWISRLSHLAEASQSGSPNPIPATPAGDRGEASHNARTEAHPAQQMFLQQQGDFHQPTGESGKTTTLEKTENLPESESRGWRSPVLLGSLASVLLLVGVLERNWGTILPTTTTPFSSAAINNPAVSASIPPQKPTLLPSPSIPPAPSAEMPSPIPPVGTSPNPVTAAPTTTRLTAPANPAITSGKKEPTRPNTQGQGSKNSSSPPKLTSMSSARAKVLIQSDQASPFWYAIQDARRIQPGDPNYASAQQDITLWSQDILSIAKRRASRRRFDTAIMAAALVPPDQSLYPNARRAIEGWCPSLGKQRTTNAAQRQQAKLICQGHGV